MCSTSPLCRRAAEATRNSSSLSLVPLTVRRRRRRRPDKGKWPPFHKVRVVFDPSPHTLLSSKLSLILPPRPLCDLVCARSQLQDTLSGLETAASMKRAPRVALSAKKSLTKKAPRRSKIIPQTCMHYCPEGDSQQAQVQQDSQGRDGMGRDGQKSVAGILF